MVEKDSGKVLVVSGNPKFGTIVSVVFFVNQWLQKDLRKIVLVDTPATLLGTTENGKTINIEAQRNEAIRKYLPPNSSIESCMCSEDDLHLEIPLLLSRELQLRPATDIVIDLTSGNKIITSLLFASGSFSKIPNLLYLQLEPRFHVMPPEEIPPEAWKIVLTEPLRNIQEIGRTGYFEIVYYLERVRNLGSLLAELRFHKLEFAPLFCTKMQNAVECFFQGKYQTTLVEVGGVAEWLAEEIWTLVEREFRREGFQPLVATKDQEESSSGNSSAIDGLRKERLEGKPARQDFNYHIERLRTQVSARLAKKRTDKIPYTPMEKRFEAVENMYCLFDYLRLERNLVAHANPVVLDSSNARLGLNTVLDLAERVFKLMPRSEGKME